MSALIGQRTITSRQHWQLPLNLNLGLTPAPLGLHVLLGWCQRFPVLLQNALCKREALYTKTETYELP